MDTVLGERFQIIRQLGKGTRGVVYLASDRQKGRHVALKLFSSPESGSFEEFQNEFSVLSHLKNPSLAEIYDFGFDPNSKGYFLAEEYFEGEPISSLSGKLDFQRLAEITAHLCLVLQFLHNQGIFHGDLKPTNILMKGNEIKLVDFGLSGHMAQHSEKERTETVSGTLPYMAPELFMGGSVDGRSDLYSLGVTLYEMIQRVPPFVAPTIPAIVEKQLFETPINPIREGSKIPKEFGFLILKLLSKDPSDRFEEANDLIRALNLQFGFNFPLGPEKPALPPERLQELKKKHVDRLYEQALRYYKGGDDPTSRKLLAQIYYRQGNWDEALALLEGLTGASVELLKLQIGLQKGEFEKVRRKAETIRLEELSSKEKGLLYNTLGTALHYLGYDADSEEAFQKEFANYEETRDRAARAALLNNLGNLRIREKKWDQAFPLYREAVTICRELGDAAHEGLFLTNLGHAYQLHHSYDEAIKVCREAEALLDAIGHRSSAAKVKGHLANIFIATGSLEKGEEKIKEVRQIADEKGDRFLFALSCLLEGDLQKKKGQRDKALAAYRQGKKFFHELKNRLEEEEIEKNIKELLHEEKEIKKSEVSEIVSIPLLRRVLAINRRLSLIHNVQEILETIIDSMIEFTAAERGHLILKEGEKYQIKVTRNINQIETEDEGFSISLVERVLKTGEPIMTFDAMTDERFSLSRSIHKLKLRSVICFPLRVREMVIGAIYLDNRIQRGAFSESTKELLQAFVDQAAIAISNATSFEELKKGSSELMKAHEKIQQSKEEIERLNQQLQESLSKKEIELREARQSLASKQAALELKYRYDEIIGRSPRMLEVLKILDRVTDSDVAVLILGESGTGKELIARAIHFNGPRSQAPFIPVNCSAIPETLLEAELFGYMRGAFTGAVRDYGGYFEMADGGTLFLDEIGDMKPTMQVKLLRVLEDGVVRRIGSENSVKFNVRLICASNRDLKAMVAEQKFREDLFYRIQGICLSLPPLRERIEDLPFLVDHILEKIAKERKAKKKVMSHSAFNLLASHPWPGNIRELENALGSACLLASGNRIEASDLNHKQELFQKREAAVITPTENSFRGSIKIFEKEMIQKALEEFQGNVSRAAKKLQVARPQLSRMIKKYGLK
ncbi:MAG: sigma 54-interacting transcriptional regulator [Deltaproteobacteria bacterium]|nr:sigma 54-interacting transcriptional regulator [Deltaproteobacteria bacterium]